MDLKLLFICALAFTKVSNEKVDNVKICVVADPKSKPGRVTKYCDLLAKSKKSPVSCVYGVDRLDCLRLVSGHGADFTVMKPEDLYFATLWPESNVLVVSELRDIRDMMFKYGTVLVVKNSLNITGLDLRQKKLCHPGLKIGSKWNDLFARYLEERVAPRNCEPNISVFEDRIKTSANFFGLSCKAGPWSEDDKEDRRLKNIYMSMCAICDLGDCSNDEKYRGSVGALLCLTDGVGDILWNRYDDVKTYFRKFAADENISKSDYSLLCEDGSLKSLDASDPCLWLAMPWEVMAANRKSASEVQKVMYQFGNGDGMDWQQNFKEAIESYTLSTKSVTALFADPVIVELQMKIRKKLATIMIMEEKTVFTVRDIFLANSRKNKNGSLPCLFIINRAMGEETITIFSVLEIKIVINQDHSVVNILVAKTPEDFLKEVPGYLSAVEMSQGNCKPNHSVRLCTTSPIEQKKCTWMSRAATSVGLQPALECVEKSDVMSCLESVSNDTSDVVVVPPDYAVRAQMKYNLKNLFYEFPSQEKDGYLLSAMVKDNSDMKSMKDLKHKTACFTTVGGVGWNSALKNLKQADWISSSCNGKRSLKEFFGEVCVMRMEEFNGEEVEVDEAEKIPICCDGKKSFHNDDVAALNCLLRKGCDVAFFDEKVVNEIQDDEENKDFKSKSVRAICSGLNCNWAWAFPNYLMINSHLNSVKFEEVNGLFSLIGEVFGRKSKNDNKIMEIFAPFQQVKNVIFKDTSVTFAKIGQWTPRNDYEEIMDEMSICSACSVIHAQRSLLLVFFIYIVVNYF